MKSQGRRVLVLIRARRPFSAPSAGRVLSQEGRTDRAGPCLSGGKDGMMRRVLGSDCGPSSTAEQGTHRIEGGTGGQPPDANRVNCGKPRPRNADRSPGVVGGIGRSGSGHGNPQPSLAGRKVARKVQRLAG